MEELQPNFKAQETLEELRRILAPKKENIKRLSKEHRESLITTREIRKKRANLFNKVLSNIQIAVSEIYPLLTASQQFPIGGSAYLQSDDPSLPFLYGTRFSVVPPNKKHRNLSALSGGEQTLAVLALICAFAKSSNTPLIVFDEVDAALDKRNVKGLANFLTRWKSPGNSINQIIIVSHKEEVYSEAQTLIGVYRNHDEGTKALTLHMDEIIQNDVNALSLLDEPDPIGFL